MDVMTEIIMFPKKYRKEERQVKDTGTDKNWVAGRSKKVDKKEQLKKKEARKKERKKDKEKKK